MHKFLTALLLALCFVGDAFGQIPGSGGIAINQTPVTPPGSASLCLYVTSLNKVGAQACGTGTASNIQVGTTTVGGGSTGRVLYDNAGVLGEMTTSGSGTVLALQTSPALITPALGVATATSIAIGGATLGGNAFAVTGTSLFNSATTFGAAFTYGGVTLSNSVTGTGSMVLSTSASLVTPALGVATATSLAIAGATLGTTALAITGTGANGIFAVTTTGVSGSRQVIVENGVNSSPTANDEIYTSTFLTNSSAAQIEAVRITSRFTTVTAGAETSRLVISVRNAGTFAEELGLTNTALFPVANGGLALGAATLGYSNLFFATAAVINFNNGNYTITHSTGLLTYSASVALTLTTDATLTTRTVCQNTANNVLHFGSGAAGICLGTSSARYKHDIQDEPAGLAEVAALRPVTYRYNPGYGDGNKLYGFVAEDVAGVLPDLVGLDKEGRPNTVDMVGMIPVLVRAVRELKVANDNLEVEVAKLKRSVGK